MFVRTLFHGTGERQARRPAPLPHFGHGGGESCYEAAPRHTMILRFKATNCRWMLAVTLCGAALPSYAETAPVVRVASDPASKPISAPAPPSRTKPRPIGRRSPTSVAAQRQAPERRADRPRRLCADAAAGLYRAGAAARLCAAGPRSGPTARADPGHRGLSQGRRRAIQFRAGPAENRRRVQGPTPRWRRRRPHPRAGGPHLCVRDRRQRHLRRQAGLSARKDARRSRQRWATTSCSAPTPSACSPSTATSSSRVDTAAVSRQPNAKHSNTRSRR